MSVDKKQSRQTEKRKYRKCLPKKAIKADRKAEIKKMSAEKKQSRQTEKKKYKKCLPGKS